MEFQSFPALKWEFKELFSCAKHMRRLKPDVMFRHAAVNQNSGFRLQYYCLFSYDKCNAIQLQFRIK